MLGAQIIISAINATLTAIFGFTVGLPYASLVIILTFACGLFPFVGTLIPNTSFFGVPLPVSPLPAGWAFISLIVIHKLEYFLNSRIIGGRLDHPMWLMLLSMVIGERLMGISGVVLAPVILSFAKIELKKVQLAHEPIPPEHRAQPERKTASA